MNKKGYIKNYGSVRKELSNLEPMSEASIPLADKVRVSIPIEIPHSLINAYAKKG